MPYKLEDINYMTVADPKGMIEEADAQYARKVEEAAEKILNNRKNSPIILLSGPSGSGKTTTAMKISEALERRGVKTHYVGMDDYYKTILPETVPRTPEGEMDLESPFCLDLELLNEQLPLLVRGETVNMPEFDFKAGKRMDRTRPFAVEPGQPVIIEGIHGLNDQLTSTIPAHMKFKVYISPLTMLNLDDHNRIRTTDARLLRRIVRDNLFRGTPPEETMGMWASVRRGEEKYIFPFQEKADAMFNSSLTYELCIMKKYAYPQLLAVRPESPHYTLARRLVKFLNYIQTADVEDEIPVNSILREFIGGCCFYKDED